MRFGPALGACSRCSRRAFSICRICSATNRLRSMSRRNSASVLGGIGSPSGVRSVLQALRRLLELRIEVADAEPRQGRLDAVDDSGLLANEGLALAVGALGIFLCEGRDRSHLAVLPLAAQPAEKGAFELLGVEPVGLGAPVLPRYRHACGMNDVGLDTARSQPARQPEAVPASLEGDGNAVDLVACLLRLLSPSLEKLQQFVLIGLELLQRLALNARYDPGDEPALLAQLDHGD